jgi:hypothetical protein
LVKRIFHESDLLQDYNHNNQHNRVEESISRIKSISQFTKLFPDLKNDLDGLIKKTNITYNKALQRNLLPMLMSTDTNNNYQTQANLYNCSSSHACNYDFFIKNNNLNQYEILSR